MCIQQFLAPLYGSLIQARAKEFKSIDDSPNKFGSLISSDIAIRLSQKKFFGFVFF
jgi:hypothetical protein